MSITREQLYAEVWAEPMLTVATRYQVSSSFLARVCRRMRVPCPPRGYWAKNRAGVKIKVPKLPSAQPGDEITWERGGGGTRLSPEAPTIRAKRKRSPSPRVFAEDGRHRHLAGVEAHFAQAREMSNGYLKPSKRLMADLFVSKKALDYIIQTANQFFIHLESCGYAVGFGSEGRRPDLQPCEGKDAHVSSYDSWHPSRPTVVQFGTLGIGLTIFEVSEEAEAKHVNGKYVRISDLPVPKRRPPYEANSWISKHQFLTGRLAVRAYSPYHDVEWQRTWLEPKAGDLPGMFEEMTRSLKRHASLLVPQVKEAMEKQRLEHERWEAERQAWIKQRAVEEEARRREAIAQARAQAISDSKKDLLAIIQTWDQAKRVQGFLTEIETAISGLDEAERAGLLERLRKAKAFLGEVDVLRAIRDWKTPEERYPHGE